MDIKVRNPETGRWIRMGGTAYNELKARGVNIDTRVKRFVAKFKAPTDYTVPHEFADYPVVPSTPRKWGMDKPDRIKDRRRILAKCGTSCFLLPDAQKPGFPICNKTMPCRYNCKGIKAAASRAGEWKYDKVLTRAKELSERFGCYKKP